jgi:predicted phage terminase large subunit-like protein
MRIRIPSYSLHHRQLEILHAPGRYKVVAAGRRFGKTILALEWLLLEPGGALDGRPVAYCAPTYKLLMEAWRRMERTLQPVIASVNRAEMRMQLITGGSVDGWTLEDRDAGRGRCYARLVIDEAAHARYLQECWEQALAPTLTDLRGAAWFISTPRGQTYFRDLFRRGESGAAGWRSFRAPTSANPHIPRSELDLARAQLPELVYRQEYEAEFVEMGAGMVKAEMLREGSAPDGLPVVLGVDLAISLREDADWTAIAAVSHDPDSGRLYLREVVRFRSTFHAVLSQIVSAAVRWQASIVAVEQVQYQAAVVQELVRTTTLPVRGVTPDRDKLTRAIPLIARYEQGLVSHDPSGVPAWYRDELLAFPAGEHDDGVDAVVYAMQASTSLAMPYVGVL